MRNLRWYLWLVVLLVVPALGAQGVPIGSTAWKLSSLSLGSGEDPLTSGIGITADFSKQGSRNLYEVAFQNEQAWLAFGPTFKNAHVDGSIVGSIGHFQGAPWGGPRLVLNIPINQKTSFGLIEWPGLFAWNPQSYKGKPFNQPIGQYGGVSLSVYSLSLSYGLQKFLGDPVNLLPGASWNMKVADAFSAVATGTYNTNANRWMFYIGSTWTPPVHSDVQVVGR